MGDSHINDSNRLAEVFIHQSRLVMQPEYIGKPEDLYMLDSGVEDVSGVRMSDAFLVRKQCWLTNYGKRQKLMVEKINFA